MGLWPSKLLFPTSQGLFQLLGCGSRVHVNQKCELTNGVIFLETVLFEKNGIGFASMRQSFWSLFHFSLSSETVLAEAEVYYRGNVVCILSTYMFFMVAHYHLWYLIYIQKCKLLALPLLFLNSDKSKTGSKMIVLSKQKNPFFNWNGFQKIMPLSIHKTMYPWAVAQQLTDILLLLLFKPFFLHKLFSPKADRGKKNYLC